MADRARCNCSGASSRAQALVANKSSSDRIDWLNYPRATFAGSYIGYYQT